MAAFLAVMFTQVGFLGHDAGHRQIFGSQRANYIAGLLHGNLGIGLSFGWWVDKHNRHHAHPNTEGADPDIAIGALAFTAAQARASQGAARLVYRCQAYLFFPMLLGEAVSLHASSIRALSSQAPPAPVAGRRRCWPPTWRATSPPCSWCSHRSRRWCSSWSSRACSACTWDAPSPPTTRACPSSGPADRSDFLRRQVLTSRNVRGGWLTDFVLGGLNYQIEHHLFPSMPRPNLRRSQALVAAFCQQQGLPYCQASLAGSYAQALRHLNTTGRAARPPVATPPVVQA